MLFCWSSKTIRQIGMRRSDRAARCPIHDSFIVMTGFHLPPTPKYQPQINSQGPQYRKALKARHIPA